jgi:hypothetical protein
LDSADSSVRFLEFGTYRRARVWEGELPEAIVRRARIQESGYEARRRGSGGIKKAAIEISVPLGGRTLYGLLGAEWRPMQSDRFLAEVWLSEGSDHPFEGSLGLMGHAVLIGLPTEFVPGVNAGIELASKILNGLTPGKMTFHCAAYSDVGTSIAVVKHLTAVLIRIFESSPGTKTDEQMVEMFPATFD